jgi:hypothetical protein
MLSKRCLHDFGHLITDSMSYEQKLATILREFDVPKWYNRTDYTVPCKFFTNCEEFLKSSNHPYVYVRHESLSAKDIMFPTIFERSKQGYDALMAVHNRSPRVQEAIRLNKLIDPLYEPIYITREVIPIDVEYRVLIVDGITKWIIPDHVNRGTEHHELIKQVVKKFKVCYEYDNYCIDVIITNGKALVLECNPLLHGMLDVSPYDDFIDLCKLDLPGNVEW